MYFIWCCCVVSRKIRKERLDILKRTMMEVVSNQPNEMIYIYYLFYNTNSSRTARNIKYEIIHN